MWHNYTSNIQSLVLIPNPLQCKCEISINNNLYDANAIQVYIYNYLVNSIYRNY